jgi:hypothetical protein
MGAIAGGVFGFILSAAFGFIGLIWVMGIITILTLVVIMTSKV